MGQPIRILQVVTYMGRGGLETMLMNYYRQIDRSRVQFDFLTHRAEPADYDKEIKALGGKIYHLPRLVPWSPSYRRALARFFREHPEYRVIHVHQDCLSGVILKVAERCGVPVRIAHSHSSSQDRNWKYPIKLYYKRSIPRYATALFACGQEAGEWMFDGAPFHILNNAIDTRAYLFDPRRAAQVREALGIPADAFVIGHVGSFAATKNQTFLLDIFFVLCRQVPEARMLLVGDGGLRGETEKKATELGLRDRIIFTGVRGDVPDLLQAMDVFVFPSIFEGLPLALVEAQAAGLPCLISDSIPPDCDLTPLVRRLSLKEPPEAWAEALLSARGAERTDTGALIGAAGFDVAENARRLQEYYLAQWEENN